MSSSKWDTKISMWTGVDYLLALIAIAAILAIEAIVRAYLIHHYRWSCCSNLKTQHEKTYRKMQRIGGSLWVEYYFHHIQYKFDQTLFQKLMADHVRGNGFRNGCRGRGPRDLNVYPNTKLQRRFDRKWTNIQSVRNS
ncbi:hypothetical protein F5B20DRAFT_433591 [Whalleya microplaca]|nr:hypothetical protein F5B20DRAFT_433591 [Whalleya microplaca]